MQSSSDDNSENETEGGWGKIPNLATCLLALSLLPAGLVYYNPGLAIFFQSVFFAIIAASKIPLVVKAQLAPLPAKRILYVCGVVFGAALAPGVLGVVILEKCMATEACAAARITNLEAFALALFGIYLALRVNEFSRGFIGKRGQLEGIPNLTWWRSLLFLGMLVFASAYYARVSQNHKEKIVSIYSGWEGALQGPVTPDGVALVFSMSVGFAFAVVFINLVRKTWEQR